MATLVLGLAGSAIGSSIGGTLFGLSAATIGGAVGTLAGAALEAAMLPDQVQQGPRLENLKVTTSTEGAVLPRVFGRHRVGGNVIWATDFVETARVTEVGGKGAPSATSIDYSYSVSFALALCEGEIGGIGRIWADAEILDQSKVTFRLYKGSDTQTADPLIVAKMGAENTPAYRGVAYIVFEDLVVDDFGGRIPQISVEVFRPLADADTAEGLVPAVTMMPGSGEFVYATEPVRGQLLSSVASATGQIENTTGDSERTDFEVSLDQLEASAPGCESVSLVVSWFGDDLRCGSCTIRPKVEHKGTQAGWSVAGLDRASAQQVSLIDDKAAFGGTPTDFSVIEAIEEMKSRGLRVTYYPFIMMDVPADNTLPDPYSDNASTVGQPAFPWRGRITASVAPGFTGTPDKTAAMDAEIDAFFGTASAADFALTPEPPPGEETYATGGEDVAYAGLSYTATHVQGPVTYTGPDEWSYRRFILHQAMLCLKAGGVDMFCIGSEMRGLTTLRGASNSFPAVAHLIALAAEVRAILGPSVKITYAADWSEYFGHQPQDSSGDVFFHLDPLWADVNIDVIGIDNYMPLSDWRDGFEHLDAQAGWPSIYDRAYLQSNIAGGEGFDWFYASDADREAQIRTPITDGAYGKPWVFRYKDLAGWWSNQHYDRPGGVESASPTPWVPESKPIVFTELGCPAVDRGTNQPNVFYDPKSSESAVPWFSRGWRDDAIQRAYLEATYLYWGDPANNPVSSVYGAPMVDIADCTAWTWDARPYPWFPALTEKWSDGENWRLGHWLTGRLGAVSLAALVRHLCLRAGLPEEQIDVSELWGAVEGLGIETIESARATISELAAHFGFDAVESDGAIRFFMRDRAPVATLTLDDLVRAGTAQGYEISRDQAGELPAALKWSVAHAGEDYDTAQVEARREDGLSRRVATRSFRLATPPEEAHRRAARALDEIWVEMEHGSLMLPPSRLALDPGDVITLDHDGRQTTLRLVAISDGAYRTAEFVRFDRSVYDRAPGRDRHAMPATPAIYGTPFPVFLDLPWLTSEHVPHRPLLAVAASPWPGDVAVWRAPASSTLTWERLATVTARAGVGTLAADLPAGPVGVFDRGSVLDILIEPDTLSSVSDMALFAGQNTFAVEATAGQWEIVQAADVELVSSGRYRLTRLLRGQRGTEWAMGDPAPAGARVVRLDTRLAELPVSLSEIGAPWAWRIGPAARPYTDTAYIEMEFAPAGAGLQCFAPAHPQLARDAATGDLLLTWLRRDRDPAADGWEAAVPLSEAAEEYELEIMSLDGASILRQLTGLSTSAYTYAAADQTADYGGPVTTIRVRLYQVGVLGRGHPLETTLSASRTT